VKPAETLTRLTAQFTDEMLLMCITGVSHLKKAKQEVENT